MKSIRWILVGILVIGVLVFFQAYVAASLNKSKDSRDPAVTQVQVNLLSEDLLRGYTVTLQEEASCTWSWVIGTARTPVAHVTNETSNKAHQLTFGETIDGQDFRLNCLGKSGNSYVGIFPRS